jgi:histidinol phosphatase-like enzyme
MKPRLAIDLDETLGTTITNATSITGFKFRHGCSELLKQLKVKYHLVLWTASNRSYLNKILVFEIGDYFRETYSWDDIAQSWKDIRKINASFLIDDDEYHLEAARKHGLESRYIIVPAYGSPEDEKDPRQWIQQIQNRLL